MIEKTFYFNYRIYVEDTDIMGIMYHANYLRFFERARTEIFRKAGFSLSELAKSNYHFAIVNAGIDFISPARLDDEILIKSQVSKQKACSLLFDQVMQNQNNKLLCKANILVACVNKEMRPKALPQFLIDKLQNY